MTTDHHTLQGCCGFASLYQGKLLPSDFTIESGATVLVQARAQSIWLQCILSFDLLSVSAAHRWIDFCLFT